MIWFTSDWHFGHDREFIWKPRGFSSVEEHDNTIIAKHNGLIFDDDDVYVLGDLMLGNNEYGLNCIKQLKGKLHIIRGNHDTDSRIALYSQLPQVVEICDAKYLRHGKFHFFLCHYPTMTGNLEKESLTQMTCNLFGHTHQKSKFYNDVPYMYHVGIDGHDGWPVLINEVIADMKHKVEECKSFLGEPNEEQLSPDEALRRYKIEECDKCVWSGYTCPGPVPLVKPKCPQGFTYKRDPPDGGYYG